MRINPTLPGLLLSFSLYLLCSCIEDPPVRVEDNSNFRLLMGGDMTRSAAADAILDNMRLYCFVPDTDNPLTGAGGSWDSRFSHPLQGITRNNMTLSTSQARAGDWDLVMVSAADAQFTPPVGSKASSQALMYTYTPGEVQADGSRGYAHEIWHRMLRMPTIGAHTSTTTSTAITRNSSMIRVVIDRAVDIDMTPGAEHLFELRGVPDKLSWSGTLLRTTAPGVYATSLDNPDVLQEPLTGKFTFTDNSAVETGTYKSNTLTFIIPAHREADFWADATNPSTNVQDTITHKMKVFVSLAKASGGKFEKEAEIDRVARCNRIMEVHIRMNDINIELDNSVKTWENETTDITITNPYLNVSELTTTVYDAAATRLYFWTNPQPADSVYVLNNANGNSNVNAIFDRIAGPRAANMHYDPETGAGYVDIALLEIADYTSGRMITLKAGSVRRNIMVNCTGTEQAHKRITTPYIGTFHRANEVGERLVTWSYSGEWTAYIDDPEGLGSHVLIDRLASPFFSNTLEPLYDQSVGMNYPTVAELGKVYDDGAVSVSGVNTIYFRVGWKTTISPDAEPRYATITVRQGLNNPTGRVIQILYLRQGEKPSAVFSRPDAALFSPYNLTAAGRAGWWPRTIDLNSRGVFTDFPTQSGAFFQWMNIENPRLAYNFKASNSGTNLPVEPEPWSNALPAYEAYWGEPGRMMPDDYETCPPGYRRVSNGATDGEPTGTSELRQSLWMYPNEFSSNNILTGFYADGHFDRCEILTPTGTDAAANSVVCSTYDIDHLAYKGQLFYNKDTKASLFFPFAGQRVATNGAFSEAGKLGYYWTASSTIAGGNASSSTAYIALQLYRNTAMSIRCVVDDSEPVAPGAVELKVGDMNDLGSNRWDFSKVTFRSVNPVTFISISMAGHTCATAIGSAPHTVYDVSSPGTPGVKTYVYVFDTPATDEQVYFFIKGLVFYRNTNASSQTVEITVYASTTSLPNGVGVTPLLHYDGSMHYYAWVPADGIHYKEAYESAKSYYYQGMRGYLATITHNDENSLLASLSAQQGWIGGAWTKDDIRDQRTLPGNDDSNIPAKPLMLDLGGPDGTLAYGPEQRGMHIRWLCGPEEYQPFYNFYWSGTPLTLISSPTYRYSNWSTQEPNNNDSERGGENVIAFNFGGESGKWGDYAPTNPAVKGYFIEFGGTGKAIPSRYLGTPGGTLGTSAYYLINKDETPKYYRPTSTVDNDQWYYDDSPENMTTVATIFKNTQMRTHVLLLH